MTWLRNLRRRLVGRQWPKISAALPSSSFARQQFAFQSAYVLVQAFYACNVYFACAGMNRSFNRLTASEILPLWPVKWIELLDLSVATYIIVALNLIGALLALFWPGKRVFRLLALIGLIQLTAFESSFGKINHGMHAWLWTAFFLLLLPNGTRQELMASRCKRQMFLNAFWLTQFAILFFYSMSGALKLVPVPYQWAHGEVCSLAPEALPRHVARRWLQTNSQSLVGRIVIEHIWLAWPLYLGSIYLELFAAVTAFRPTLQRIWGLCLITMHIAIALAMSIWFTRQILLVALLIVHSPFAHQKCYLRQVILDLPVFGAIAQRLGVRG